MGEARLNEQLDAAPRLPQQASLLTRKLCKPRAMALGGLGPRTSAWTTSAPLHAVAKLLDEPARAAEESEFIPTV